VLVGIKYCGGCRAAFDRRAEAERTVGSVLKAGGAAKGISFVDASDGGVYDVLLAVCGCPALCADLSAYKAERIVYISSEGDAARAAQDIKECMAIV